MTVPTCESPQLQNFDDKPRIEKLRTQTPSVSQRKWVPDPESSDCAGRSRTIVLCFDGTGDQFDNDNSNVIKLFSALKKDDQKMQLVYYQSGIGTYLPSTFTTPVMTQVAKTLDEAFAWNFSSHVKDGYKFLMQNYTVGDKISIFGFSRGAYTARALAGMVEKVGLLPKCNEQQLPFAWSAYARNDMSGCIDSVAFKKTFSIDVKIDFVGVWDTVASVGVRDVDLPFVADNDSIRVFRHAVALDERRVMFLPNFYHEDAKQKTVAKEISDMESDVKWSSETNREKQKIRQLTGAELWQYEINSEIGTPTDAKEVWFAGCHCDIGGGSVSNDTRHSLARIPLRWMIRECFRSGTGIIFDAAVLREIGLEPNSVMQERPPRRSIADMSSQLKVAETPESSIVAFLRFLVDVAAIPIKVLIFLFKPFKHILLLLYDSYPIKHIRKRPAFKNLKESRVAKWVSKRVKGKKQKKEEAKKGKLEADSSMKAQYTVDEEEEELHDILSPEYDQLAISKFWWILECLPMRHHLQNASRKESVVRCNLGQGREIYGDAMDGGLFIHRSVKTRLEAQAAKGKSMYKPRAWFKQLGSSNNEPIDWNIENPDPKQWQWVD